MKQLDLNFDQKNIDPTLEKIDPEIARIFAQHWDDKGKLDYENYVLAIKKIFAFVDLGDDSEPELAKMEINFLNRRAGDFVSP